MKWGLLYQFYCRRATLVGTLVGTVGMLVTVCGTAQTLKPSAVIPLLADTHHVQGIDVEASRLWATAVDKTKRRGLLFEFELPSGRLLRSVELQQGERYHPGGIMADADSLWMPVAEYKRESSAVIQRRSKSTLKLIYQFEVKDHIGAVAVTPHALWGANWDAKDFYVWDKQGKQISKQPNELGTACQDMKFTESILICSGLRPDKSGAIEWIHPQTSKRIRTLEFGQTDRGVAYTHEGMAIGGRKLYLLPEDSPSRLFIFDLP